MRELHNYSDDLILRDEYKDNGYAIRRYNLKCCDENKNATYIQFELYYTHCNYELYVDTINVTELSSGGKVYKIGDEYPIKLVMFETTYRYSKKQMDKAEDFMRLNLRNLITQFCKMNKNISVE